MSDPTGKSHQRQRAWLLMLGGCLLLLLCSVGGGMALLLNYSPWEPAPLPTAPLTSVPLPTAPLTSVPLPSAALPSAALPTALAPPLESAATVAVVTATPRAALPTETVPATQLPTVAATTTAVSLLPVPPEIVQEPIPPRAAADLDALLAADYPARDYFETAVRLGRADLGRRQFERTPFQLGDRQPFYTDEGEIEATLLAITDHAYFWVEDGLGLEETAVQAAAAQFEEDYALLADLFGQEWRPGIDGDPRFSVLHLAAFGDAYELGYFTDQDEYPSTLFPESNEQEMVYLNMGQLELGSTLYEGTLIHEVQHLIQWHLDRNEAGWLNEGLSQLAELYVGLNTASTIAYLEQPDVRLNTWEYEEDVVDAHYAASYLYSVYLWEQLGEEALHELVRHPANGLAGVRAVLQGHRPNLSLEQFTADWAVANYLDDPAAGAAYNYVKLDLERPRPYAEVNQLPFAATETAAQFGVHYVELDGGAPLTLSFAGDTVVALTDAPPPSGDTMWFAPPVDDTDAQLTAAFDLRGVATATLEFSAWYDLEEAYDYAYVAVSNDQGATWSLMLPQRSVAGEYGPGLNGRSIEASGSAGGWVRETVSLDAFAGQEVVVRFHVLTDFENSAGGFALDDIAIPQIGYFSDVETAADGWEGQGMVRVGWQLPQQWAVRLIQHGPETQVISLPLDGRNQVQQTVEVGPAGGTLVIVPLTPLVDRPARYWLSLAP